MRAHAQPTSAEIQGFLLMDSIVRAALIRNGCRFERMRRKEGCYRFGGSSSSQGESMGTKSRRFEACPVLWLGGGKTTEKNPISVFTYLLIYLFTLSRIQTRLRRPTPFQMQLPPCSVLVRYDCGVTVVSFHAAEGHGEALTESFTTAGCLC